MSTALAALGKWAFIKARILALTKMIKKYELLETKLTWNEIYLKTLNLFYFSWLWSQLFSFLFDLDNIIIAWQCIHANCQSMHTFCLFLIHMQTQIGKHSAELLVYNLHLSGPRGLMKLKCLSDVKGRLVEFLPTSRADVLLTARSLQLN